MPVTISIARTTEDIQACYTVMKQLRADISPDGFVDMIRELMESGYRLVSLDDSGAVVAVAGFRIGRSLAWKSYLYVDDLVTLAEQRSRGYGTALLEWLSRYASKQGCEQMHLDSGLQRKDAHRFYLREGMSQSSYHFVKTIKPANHR